MQSPSHDFKISDQQQNYDMLEYPVSYFMKPSVALFMGVCRSQYGLALDASLRSMLHLQQLFNFNSVICFDPVQGKESAEVVGRSVRYQIQIITSLIR